MATRSDRAAKPHRGRCRRHTHDGLRAGQAAARCATSKTLGGGSFLPRSAPPPLHLHSVGGRCQHQNVQLDTIRDMIAQSSSSNWHSIEYGDIFRSVAYHGDDSYRSQHGSRAVLKTDVNISIEWGIPTRNAQNESGHLWVKEHSFPDPHIHSFWVDVFYMNALVDRVRAYDVDGGRSYLPRYKQRRTDEGGADDFDSATWRFEVERWPYDLTRLINGLDSHREFDSYFSRSGFTLVDQQIRQPPAR